MKLSYTAIPFLFLSPYLCHFHGYLGFGFLRKRMISSFQFSNWLCHCAENHNERVVCVRNLPPEEILLQATRLRNSLGRKVVKLRTRHVTKRPSVQGTWTTDLKM